MFVSWCFPGHLRVALVHTGRHTTSVKCGIWGSHISVVVYVIGRVVADVSTLATTPNDAAYTAQDLYASLRTYVSAIFRYISPFCSQCCGLRCQVCKYNSIMQAYRLSQRCSWSLRSSGICVASLDDWCPTVETVWSYLQGPHFRWRWHHYAVSKHLEPSTDEAPYPRTKTSTALVQLRLNIHCGIKYSTTVELNTPTMQVLLRSDCAVHSVDVNSNQCSLQRNGGKH